MAQITIYVSEELKRRMRRHPQVNFSRAAAEGLERALAAAEEEQSNESRAAKK